jgi:hypothetical protein
MGSNSLANTEFPKQLAKVFRGWFIKGYDASAPWLICCQYCGACSVGQTLEEAGQEFELHMVWGFDTSKQHFEYAAGKRKPARSRAKTLKGQIRHFETQLLAAQNESSDPQQREGRRQSSGELQ